MIFIRTSNDDMVEILVPRLLYTPSNQSIQHAVDQFYFERGTKNITVKDTFEIVKGLDHEEEYRYLSILFLNPFFPKRTGKGILRLVPTYTLVHESILRTYEEDEVDMNNYIKSSVIKNLCITTQIRDNNISNTTLIDGLDILETLRMIFIISKYKIKI